MPRKPGVIVCFPALEDNGLNSRLSGHFGSAPWFVAVDTDTQEVKAIANQNKVHEHGQCNPLSALSGLKPDVVVVQGIGPGAINKLQAMNIKVMRCQASTVQEALRMLAEGPLPEMTLDDACKSHGTSC